MNNRQTGTRWEQRAVSYLIQQGYEILECNYRCSYGEIDIIAKEPLKCHRDFSPVPAGILCFVEVKYRNSTRCGFAVEAVTPSKQRTIRRVALHYMTTILHDCRVLCRFDVLGFDREHITLIRDAF